LIFFTKKLSIKKFSGHKTNGKYARHLCGIGLKQSSTVNPKSKQKRYQPCRVIENFQFFFAT